MGVSGAFAQGIKIGDTVFSVDTLQRKHEIGQGTTYASYSLPDYPLRFYVLEIDLANANVQLETCFANDSSLTIEAPTEMIKRHDTPQHKIIAGTNGDFYFYKDSIETGIPRSGQFQKNECTANPTGRASFVLAPDDTPFIDRVDFSGVLKTADKTKRIHTVNMLRLEADPGASTNMLTLYTSAFGHVTSSLEGGTKVVIRPNDKNRFFFCANKDIEYIVEDIFPNAGTSAIPEAWAVLHGRGTSSDFLQSLNKGDQVTINLATNLRSAPGLLTDFKELTGGSDNIILKNGEKAEGDLLYNPRTGIGISKDKTKIFLVVADGRNDESKGATMVDFGQIFKALGAWDAVNMDGGGSSVMVVDNEVVNSPSDGYVRPVGTGLLIVETPEPNDKKVQRIEFKPGSTIELPVHGLYRPVMWGYNKDGILISKDFKNFTLSCSSNIGYINSKYFFVASDKPGKGRITATYKGISINRAVNVRLFPENMPAESSARTMYSSKKIPTYQNPNKSVSARVTDLLQRMTLEEKIAQMRHIHFASYNVEGHLDLNKLSSFVKGKSFGCIEAFPYSAEEYAKTIYEAQKYMREETRLGIPVLPVMEALHGTVQDGCTIYPQSIALGSSFDPDLVKEMAENIALDIRAIGAKQVLAPVLDLARELRWGRVEETYGEDPYLVSRMGVAYVQGLREHGIICTPKHFIGHGTPTGGLNLAPVAGGKRELLNLYMQPFEKVIREGNPLSIMNCYSAYDCEPIAASPYILTELLRNELRFKGYVYADWGSVGMLESFHRTAANGKEAARQAVVAGIDLEAGSGSRHYENLLSLVNDNELDISYIDSAVSHILYAKFESGLFDEPLPDTSNVRAQMHTPQSILLAKKLADESAVLLKNENMFLPLNLESLKSIAVIGPNSDMAQFGDYTWGIENAGAGGITPLKGIADFVGDGVKVHHAKGCDLVSRDISGFPEAIKAAKKSDVAVVFLGSQSALLSRENNSVPTCGESFDLSDLSLTGVQEQLVKAIYKTGTPVVLVLVTGRPFAIPWEKEHLPAIIVQWYPGEEGGNSIAGILFGKVNPSGKLAISFPRSTGQTPVYYNYLPSDKGYYNQKGSPDNPGRDYVFSNPYPLYPFGYGLSYTRFEFSDFHLTKQQYGLNDTVCVQFEIKNTGNREGKEVAQLYVRDLVSTIETPVQQLKAFQKTGLGKGEKTKVTLSVPVSELYLYNRNYERVVEPGDFELQVGSSSQDIHFKQVFTVYDGDSPKEKIVQSETEQTKLPETNVSKNARKVEVKGVVTDAQANLLKGVRVTVEDLENSAKTDSQGKYTIQVREGDWLVFDKKGFKTEKIQVEKDLYTNVSLFPEGK